MEFTISTTPDGRLQAVTSGFVANCFLDEDDRTHQIAYSDGYWFGDRLLEGVMFRLELLPDGRLSATVAPGSAAYMRGLNEREWLGVAVIHAAKHDIFYQNEGGGGDDMIFNTAVPDEADRMVPIAETPKPAPPRNRARRPTRTSIAH